MSALTIRDLKAAAAAAPVQAEVQAQVESAMLKPTRNGSEFLELKLADGGDSLTLRVWSDHPSWAELRTSAAARNFIAITGEWTSGQYGVDAKNWTCRPLTAAEKSTLLCGPADIRDKQATDYSYIEQSVAALTDPRLRSLGQAFLTEYGERFRRTAAAREYHHARRGGLVEHVAQMMRTAAAVCGAYPTVNAELVVTGVLFHDCGKLWENCYPAEGFHMPYSETGELLGHITMGIELVNRLWRRITDLPEAGAWLTMEPPSDEVRLHLLHLIGSHHGEYAFGSPVLPRTPEAIVLHHVDNIDAKLEMMFTTYQTSALLGKNIFERRRPLPNNLVRPLPSWDDPSRPLTDLDSEPENPDL